MNKSDLIAITEKYIAFSNQSDIESIAKLFDKDATYCSEVVGIYYGKQAIIQMKMSFYATITTPYWNVEQYNVLSENIVRFIFDFQCIELATKASIKRRGVETVVVNNKGLIQHVDVKKLT